jgi:hypothetical protein
VLLKFTIGVSRSAQVRRIGRIQMSIRSHKAAVLTRFCASQATQEGYQYYADSFVQAF